MKANHSKPGKLLAWIVFMLVAPGLACSAPNVGIQNATPTPVSSPIPLATLAPTAVPTPLPPALVASNPPPGSEIALASPITLYFNQAMDRPTVEASLSGQPALAGKFAWPDDDTLVFTPDAPFLPNTQLVLTVNNSARSRKGLSLVNPLSLSYRVAGYLRLTQGLPKPGASEVDPTSAVVAAFNRPVVSLGAGQAAGSQGNAPITISSPGDANPHGRGEWINTSTYVFYPDPALAGGATYSVKVNTDLTSTDGSPLSPAVTGTDQAPLSWSFTTAQPSLVSLEPANNTGDVRLDAPVVATFNQSMDPDSTAAGFHLLDGSSAEVPGAEGWNKDFTTLTFTPTAQLKRNSTYITLLSGQVQARGGTLLGQDSRAVFYTAPLLRFLGIDQTGGSVLKPYAPLGLNFSAPVTDKDPLQYFKLTPAVSDLTVSGTEDGRLVYLSGSFQPSTSYALVISGSLPDAWGASLGQDIALSFQTAAADPSLQINQSSDVLFLRPEDTSLEAQVTNLKGVNYSLGSVPVQDLINMEGPDGFNIRRTYLPGGNRSLSTAFNLAPDRSQPADIPLTDAQHPLATGLYYLRFNLDARIAAGNYVLVVSNTQLTIKLSPTDIFVLATDLRSGQFVAQAPINVYDENGGILVSGQTNAEGVFQENIPPLKDAYSLVYVVLGQPGDDTFGLALSNWSLGISSFDFGLSSDYTGPHLKTYLYTDRPIYRPGQTVYFRAIARQADNGRYSLPADQDLKLSVSDDLGQELATLTPGLSAFGTAHGEYSLPPGATPGYYRLSSGPDSISFQVADYRKPEINLQVSLDSPSSGSTGQGLAGVPLQGHVNARYFFDAPVSNVAVHWELNQRPTSFDLPGYQVGALDLSWAQAFNRQALQPGLLGFPVKNGDAHTGPDGLLTLDFPADGLSAGLPPGERLYILEVTITDESGAPVSARAETILHPANFYLGVRPDTWVGQAGTPLSYDILAVDWNKKPSGAHTLQAKFQSVEWVQPASQGPFTPPSLVPKYTLVSSTDFATSQDGLARLAFAPPAAGAYELDVLQPPGGAEPGSAITQVLVWVGGAAQAAWPNLPNSRLHLAADREQYKPGDTANVFIPNALGGDGLALVTVERSRVLRYQILPVTGSGATYSLPLTSAEAPNIYVSVTLMGKNSQGVADFRQGYIDLPVEPVEQKLNVELTSQPERAGPGDAVTFSIRVTDDKGAAVQGEFSLSVVDAAILSLADPNSQDILPAFFGDQPLGVRTSLDLAVYARRNVFIPGGLGGGGGGSATTVARENFPDTAYWNATILTDASGLAQVSMKLPDNLTTWIIDVRGLTADTRVGQASTQVITSKDLLVRPETPRFLVAGDHALLAAIVQNNTASDLQAKVSFQGPGFDLDDLAGAVQQVAVPANGRARVEWWGTAQAVDKVDLLFSAQAGSLQDAVRPVSDGLPVLNYAAPQAFGSAGVLAAGGERLEVVSLPPAALTGRSILGGDLSLSLSPSLAAAMLGALDSLDAAPYESAENLVSRFLPTLEAYRAIQSLGLQDEALQTRLERSLTRGLARTLARQNSDGGWGWWPGDASDAFLTAYALLGLVQVQQAGLAVSDAVIQQTSQYLAGSLVDPKTAGPNWMLDRLAFEQYVLSQAGVGSRTGLDGLFAVRDQLSPWSRALLALSLEKISPADTRIKTIVSDLESGATSSAAGASWQDPSSGGPNMSTSVSATGLVVFALAQLEPAATVLPEAVRYLMAARQPGGGWSSTYETAWAVMALTEYMKGTGELNSSFSFSASLNGAPMVNGQAGGDTRLSPVSAQVPLTSLSPADPNALLIQRGDGPGRLYYSAYLNVNQPVETAAAIQHGFSLSRQYFSSQPDCLQGKCPPIQAGQAGQLVRARLTLVVPQDSYYVVVEDPIPAGAEVLDLNLKTSQQGQPGQPGGEVQYFDGRSPFAAGWGWWLFHPSQIFDDHISWSANFLPAGTYILDYNLSLLQPGSYHVLPAHAWQYYFPDVQGTSAGALFEIR